ncbi:hypothetical protein M427DRAFT_268098 [Gonapodya prolifera JEL478]|uniref:Uncharacterized protein n=1 Tax=Gonapodya prolifera (strain JEL478) TaxID=1344416 RepID=A0A139AJI7_GONPJ|nr:hypothetical protein M427DRAFT_268098 [Gonapodya prolifera JEL478]|eukprot:KXS16947.1 hypothetical protein M427DRAFT_268098 [Gonapodya prolifera JEL478]
MSMNPNNLGKTPGSPTWLQVKQGWWRQTIQADVFDLLPQYKISYRFEFVKQDTIPGVSIDFGYTVDPQVAAAFVADLPTSRIHFGNGQFIFINAGNTPLPGIRSTPVGGASTSTAPVTSAPPKTSTTSSASPTPALSSNKQVALVKGTSVVGATPLGWAVTMVLALVVVCVCFGLMCQTSFFSLFHKTPCAKALRWRQTQNQLFICGISP